MAFDSREHAPVTPAAPAATPAPVAPIAPIAPAPAPISEESIKSSLSEAGLQWVQTDPNKAASEAAPEPAPQRGRAPRQTSEKSSEEPLVMVETRQPNS